jgi:uncharacterized membrane protein (DUF106 family)
MRKKFKMRRRMKETSSLAKKMSKLKNRSRLKHLKKKKTNTMSGQSVLLVGQQWIMRSIQ